MGMGGGMPMPMGGGMGQGPPGMEPDGDEMGGMSPLLMALMSSMSGGGGGQVIPGQSLGVDLGQGGPGDPGMGLEQLLQMLAMSQGGMGGTDPSLGGGSMPGGSGVPQGMPGMGMGGY